MKTQGILLPTLLLAPALVAAPRAATEITFKVAEGSTNTKTYTGVVEMTLDNMDMSMNGQEPPMMPEIDMSLSATTEVKVTDEYLAMGDGQPKKLKRTYDSLSSNTEMQMEMDMMGQTQTQDMPMSASSELEGETVQFALNDDGEYVASFPEGEGDEELLTDLWEDMDLRGFLPSGAVSEGDEWTVPGSALAAMLAPGGNLKLVPEDMDLEDMMGMNSNLGSMSDWFTESIEGEIVAKFAGVREGDSGKLAVIELRVDVSNAVDLTEMVEAAMENVDLPPEASDMDFDHLDLELELTGEGSILWNLDAGRFQSLQLSGDMSLMMNIGMAISAQGMDMEIEQTIEMSGTINQSASVE